MTDDRITLLVGLPRTGTSSVARALQQMGHPVLSDPFSDGLMDRLYMGDFGLEAEIAAGWRVFWDVTISAWWKEIYQQHPDARVIVTVREVSAWAESLWERAITQSRKEPGRRTDELEALAAHSGLNAATFPRHLALAFADGGLSQVLAGADLMLEMSRRVTEVCRIVERPLVIAPANAGEDGDQNREVWRALAEFMGYRGTAQPFPHANKGRRAEWR